MPALLISAAGFLAIAAAIVFVGYRKFAQPAQIARRISEPAATVQVSTLDRSEQTVTGPIAWLTEIGKHLPTSEAETATLRRDLIQAGFRQEHAVLVFNGAKIATTVVLALVALLLRESFTDNPVLRVVMIGMGVAVGLFLPGMVLDKIIEKRQKRLRLSLPDALDLMVVSVEAGLGLDQAILNVSRELVTTHREISEELSLMNLEMRAGKRRADALRNLAERTGEPELRKLVSILIQSDRFGTSMGESLRTHSDFMRVRRRQEAEERAGKVGVKLVFPIFFFILPSMMVVAAGPGLLQLFKRLFPMMKEFGR
jgi:tight adherence protein C